MSLTVVTGWSPAGWFEYGQRFLMSFDKHWPADVALVVYGEQDQFAHAGLPSGRPYTFRCLDEIPGCVQFLEDHFDDLPARGQVKLDKHRWKERAITAGYNWRFDAWKFCRQGFIPWHASLKCNTDYLCWLDGDVVTHAPIRSSGVITGLMPAEKAVAYLGREPKHPDIAFQLYRLGVPCYPGAAQVLEFLHRFSEMYRTGKVFELPEWHSAYVWKHCAEATPALAPHLHNLTPGGTGHVWHQSPLRWWGDHLKGNRKTHGRSPERR